MTVSCFHLFVLICGSPFYSMIIIVMSIENKIVEKVLFILYFFVRSLNFDNFKNDIYNTFPIFMFKPYHIFIQTHQLFLIVHPNNFILYFTQTNLIYSNLGKDTASLQILIKYWI